MPRWQVDMEALVWARSEVEAGTKDEAESIIENGYPDIELSNAPVDWRVIYVRRIS